MATHRFRCPSSDLVLATLVKRGRTTLLLGLGTAIVAHLCLTQATGLRQEQRAAKPLTTQFVKRAPRLTKPLELKKRPSPKRRQIQRQMVAVRARAGLRETRLGFQAVEAARSLARPDVRVGRAAAFGAIVSEPETVAQQIAGAREDKHAVDMSLEMVDIEALDTGKFHAMIIEDPKDKRQVRGFFHLLLARPRSLSDFGGRGGGTSVWDDMKIAIERLVDSMNRWTQIHVEVAGQITFDDAELHKVPWVMTPIPDAQMYVTPSEAANMGRYLSTGGFQFLENAWGCNLAVNMACLRIMADIMGSAGLVEGRDWSYERLPKDHAVYHCYYDFDVPPYGEDLANYYARRDQALSRMNPADYLEGITIEGRLWILFGRKGYAVAWHDWRPGGYVPGNDATRILQFGINTIVFALTQEGSITKQVMDTVRY